MSITKPWATSQSSEENLLGGYGLEGVDPKPYSHPCKWYFKAVAEGEV